MATLLDYLDANTLQQLQDAFAGVSRLSLLYCAPDGQPLTRPSPGAEAPAGEAAAPPTRFDVPVALGERIIGRIVMETRDPTIDVKALPGSKNAETATRVLRFLGLVAGMLSRLCDRENQLRERLDELTTLYRLTAEFAGQRDLQSVLDLVTRTVVDVLKAKACSIRLLNEERTELVIKAVAGLSPGYLNKGPIVLSRSSIDQEVLTTGESMYIADERNDPRVLYPAEARREGIVSALCAPMSYKGRPEGVIHVYMAEAHAFDRYEVSLLQSIAAQAAAAIVNARLYAETVDAANMKRQIQLAAEVQRRMIPLKPPEIPGFQLGAIYVPTFELGGDFYDFLPLPPDNMGIAVCDVVGKGVRASLLMASTRASLRAHAANIYSMSEVVSRVNRDLCDDALVSDFATLFYGVLNYKTRRFTYCDAGHPPAILLRDGHASYLSTGGSVIGIDTTLEWKHDVVDLKSGDVLIAYTDGLSEALNFDNEAFGRERIERAALAGIAAGQPAEGVVRHVLWEMRRFAGLQTRFDDLTIIAIKAL